MFSTRYFDEEIAIDPKECKTCGEIYSHVQGHPEGCLQCISDESVRVSIVRGYIYAKGNNVPMQTISKELKISITQLNRMVRQETLSLTPESAMAGLLRCEKCGASISTGRHCYDCIALSAPQVVRSAATFSGGGASGRFQSRGLSTRMR